MFLFDLLNFKKECTHSKIMPDVDYAYCPDCGKLIQNVWYLARCSCCNIKRKTYVINNKIKPETSYCPNCGAKEIYVEELEHINFIDINFASLVKEVIQTSPYSENTQIWTDNRETIPKLLSEIL